MVLFFARAELWPEVGYKNKTCNEPHVISYHIHVRWDVDNATQAHGALEAKYLFMKEFNIPETLCPMSHADAGQHYEKICYFPFKDSPPYSYSHIFGGADYAFFVPKLHYMQVMNWWRLHHSTYLVDYAMHTNTGCGYKDHSLFSMTSYGYPIYNQKLDGLWCCKEKPPGCICTLVQYQSSSSGLCLVQNGSSLVMDNCTSSTFSSWGWDVWRETQYTENFAQMENYGDKAGGENSCITVGSTCEPPMSFSMKAPCNSAANRNLVEWNKEMGMIRDQICGLCLDVESMSFVNCRYGSRLIRKYID